VYLGVEEKPDAAVEVIATLFEKTSAPKLPEADADVRATVTVGIGV
jgi:hypothetical protein